MTRFSALASLCLACQLAPVDAGETLDGSSSGASTTSPDPDDDDGGTNEDGGTTTADTGAADDASSSAADEMPGTSEGGAPVCTPNEGFACEAPVDCVDFAECGTLLSPFDELGCGRPRCGATTACDEGSVCFRPSTDWGECVGSGTCEQAGETCDCFIQLDCGAEYCLPADVAPPAACLAIEDMATCRAAGCDVVTALGMSTDLESCTCEPVELCMWIGDSVPTAEPTAYNHGLTGLVVLLPSSYEPLPLGLSECSAPECPCNDDCA